MHDSFRADNGPQVKGADAPLASRTWARGGGRRRYQRHGSLSRAVGLKQTLWPNAITPRHRLGITESAILKSYPLGFRGVFGVIPWGLGALWSYPLGFRGAKTWTLGAQTWPLGARLELSPGV